MLGATDICTGCVQILGGDMEAYSSGVCGICLRERTSSSSGSGKGVDVLVAKITHHRAAEMKHMDASESGLTSSC